jgi:dissimilatory sulfite reductase related protein
VAFCPLSDQPFTFKLVSFAPEMAKKTYGGITVDVTDDGYLTDPAQWNMRIAEEIAEEEGIILTPEHISILEFLRQRFINGDIVSIRSINHSGIVDVKTFYSMFPGAPLRKSARIAGIPKPSSCV